VFGCGSDADTGWTIDPEHAWLFDPETGEIHDNLVDSDKARALKDGSSVDGKGEADGNVASKTAPGNGTQPPGPEAPPGDPPPAPGDPPAADPDSDPDAVPF
jgi:hypothetical protein